MNRILTTVGLLFKLLILNFLCSICAVIVTIPLPGGYEQNKAIFEAVMYCITIVVLYKYYIKKGNLIQECNFNKMNFKDTMYTILMGIGLSGAIDIIIIPLVKVFPSYIEIANKMMNEPKSIISIVCLVILAPIFEEIVFRGILFDNLKRNYSIVTSIIAQALIFGVMHGNAVQAIYAFLTGIVFVLVNIYSGSILGGIILHMIFNLLGASGIQRLFGFTDLMYDIEVIVELILFVYALYKMIKSYKKRVADCKSSQIEI